MMEYTVYKLNQAEVALTELRRILPLPGKCCAIAALLCLALLSGCAISPRRTLGGGGGGTGGGGGGTATGGKLYVTSGNSIVRFDSALSALGNIAPGGTIIGPATTLSLPQALQIDPITDRLYVANQGANSIVIFPAASTANANAAPIAIIAGSNTGLSLPIGIALDNTRDILYVANGTSILVFGNVSTMVGNVNTAPAQSFITGLTIKGIAVDDTNNILYVADAVDNQVAIYQSANAQSGVGFANGTIVGADTTLNQPSGIAIDSAGRLIVSSPGGPNITAFPNPTIANGDVLPAAVIIGSNTGLSSPLQIATTSSITNGALFVADNQANVVQIYAPISTVTGTVNLAPVRQLSGALTTLNHPIGIALDSSR